MSPLRGVRKGNTFEGKVAEYTGTERRVLAGVKDKGDLVLRISVSEIKCPGRGQPFRPSEWMNEAKVEAAHAGVRYYNVIARRTGYPVEEAFFIVPLWQAKERGWIE